MIYRRLHASIIAAAMTLAAAGVAALPGVAKAATASTPASVVDSVLPGAQVSVTQPATTSTGQSSQTPYSSDGSYTAGGEALSIQLPASAIPTGQTPMQSQFTYQELGWRASLAVGVIDATQPISEYQVTTATGDVPTTAADAFHGSFASGWTPGSDPALDTLSSDTALAQLKSNLNVLTQALPAGSVQSSSATLVPIGSSSNQYALDASVTLTDASALNGHYGDALVGMETGLVGNVATSPIEGVAVTIYAADGTPIAGEWSATRAQSGTTAFGDPATAPTSYSVTTNFPVLTGVPAITSGAVGAPGTAEPTSPSKTHGSATTAATNRVATGSGLSWPFALGLVGIVVAISGGVFYIVTRRRRAGLSRTHLTTSA